MALTTGPAFEMYRGEERVWTMTITEDSTAINLLGATLKFTVREVFPSGTITSDADAVFTCTSPTEILLTQPTDGIVELVISKAKTNTIRITGITEYQYGLEYVPSDSTDPRVIAQGLFTLYPDVVRA